MQGPAWIGLIRSIPRELHETFALVLTTGLEVLIQSIVRMDRDFMVVRCRMAGSQDSGRLVIIPFDQVNFLAFNKKLTEEEAIALLGKPQTPAVAEPEPMAIEEPIQPDVVNQNLVPEAAPPVSSPTPTNKPAEVASKEAPAPAKPGQVSKSILLARLRARLAK